MGLIRKQYLQGTKLLGCSRCGTHLSTSNQIISHAFHGQHGKAILVNDVINVTEGEPEDRRMSTGLHQVCDIYCIGCSTVLGWRYVHAYESSQKYKEGKYILEVTLISTDLCDEAQESSRQRQRFGLMLNDSLLSA